MAAHSHCVDSGLPPRIYIYSAVRDAGTCPLWNVVDSTLTILVWDNITTGGREALYGQCGDTEEPQGFTWLMTTGLVWDERGLEELKLNGSVLMQFGTVSLSSAINLSLSPSLSHSFLFIQFYLLIDFIYSLCLFMMYSTHGLWTIWDCFFYRKYIYLLIYWSWSCELSIDSYLYLLIQDGF